LALRHGYVVATRNTKDFRHAKTFNPWLAKSATGQKPVLGKHWKIFMAWQLFYFASIPPG